MSKVSVFTKFSCVAGKEKELEQALAELVDVVEGSNGVEVYSYHRGDDGSYWFFALMSNREAAEKHGENPKIREIMPKLMKYLAGPPAPDMATPLKAIGLSI